MFIDEAKIEFTAGKGGDGAVHFRKEKFIPKGGPDGGNGGRGGDVWFETVNNIHTLSDFRNKKEFKAMPGKAGGQKLQTGKSGDDLVIRVPQGTIIREQETGRVLADLTELNQKIKLAQGGIGGKGNAGFVNSVRQAPAFAEKGDVGEHFKVELELKLVADVALVGYPSVGKSTFISVVSNAKPKVAEYHFTTLVPNLGVCNFDDRELVFVDVPGLIEGASEGKGLGHQFLRHIERARMVLQLVDVNSDTPLKDFQVIRKELESFSPELAAKPFVPVLCKIDTVDEELQNFVSKEFEAEFGLKPYLISAATHAGMDTLLKHLVHEIPEERKFEVAEEDQDKAVEFRPGEQDDSRFVQIEKKENWWNLNNVRLSQIGRQTDWENAEGQERVYDVLRKWGIIKQLEKAGAEPGDQLRIGEEFLEYRG
ncbi:GTPase ObgE [Candidatus Peregrinibacteria bacterium]|nr:GTPase ObgE [bacterium]NCQ55792.1 GTPase ObgE [Candidatus Parcubacteria bacterium]NCS67859.1 GTPase ObgE [Candidatus Peregrinibacteria bacterium]